MSYFVDHFGDTFKVIRNYIPVDEARRLGENYKKFVSTDGIPTNENITNNAYDYYNRPEQVALLSEKVSEINTIFDRKVIPSFSYIRQYECGASLSKHVDRSSCEVSLSIHLYGDKEWAFSIEDKEGDPVEVYLQPGDAVIYDAHNAQHWREEYTGEFYIQSFHFYVLLDGDNESHLFDNNHDLLSLSTYIKHYTSEVNSVTCDGIIKYAEDRPDRWQPATTTSADGGMDERVCDMWNITGDDKIDEVVFNSINPSINKYRASFPTISVEKDWGYSILRYKPGGKYNYHTDQGIIHNREITIIFNLNDEYEGGSLSLHKEYETTEMGQGDIIIFPSNFMYPHRINPVTSGVRYSIVTWMI